MNLRSRIRILALTSRVTFHSSETYSDIEAFHHYILKWVIGGSNDMTREEDQIGEDVTLASNLALFM